MGRGAHIGHDPAPQSGDQSKGLVVAVEFADHVVPVGPPCVAANRGGMSRTRALKKNNRRGLRGVRSLCWYVGT
jgi:hypothetical protein